MSGLVESSADARSKTIGGNFRCRAWVNFYGNSGSGVGSNVTVRGSGNVSSVTDLAPGQYQINFTTDMPNANYCAVAMGQREDYDNGDLNVACNGNASDCWAVGELKVATIHSSSGTATDARTVAVAVFS